VRRLRRVLTLSLTLVTAILEQAKSNLENWLKTMRLYDERLALTGRDRMWKLGESGIPAERPVDCLQAIIDGLEDEVMIIGPDFRVRQANNAVLRRLETQAADIVGQPCFRVSHGTEEPCRPPWCECPLNQVFETGQSIRLIHSHWESQVDEGSERWVEIVASPIWDSDGHITDVIELVKDVSESKRLQKEILRANRELLALNSIAHALSQSLDLKATLQAVAETMLDALEVQVSWVKLSDDTSRIPAAQASRGLSAEALDKLMETASSTGSSEQTATSASYFVASGDGTDGRDQTLWQFAVTQLKSKEVVLGTAGVATARRPVDQQRIQLLDAIGNQIAVTVERCKLYEEVQLARDLRGELLHKVITAQEEERRRIARELHDEAGQALTALRLCLERLALTPTSSAEEVKARLAQPLSLCQQAEEDIDKLIFALRPALLDDLGLVEAIEFYAQTRLKTAGIEVNLRVTGKERRLSGETEAALFRVMQEGVTNIVRHARAKSATINLQFKTNQLVARLEDDGCGFEMSQIVSPRNARYSLGLLGMRERMSLVGGSLSIVSKPGVGTRLKAVVPLAEEGV